MNSPNRRRRAGGLQGLPVRLQSGIKPWFTGRNKPTKKGVAPPAGQVSETEPRRQMVELRLYIAGQTPKSLAAVNNLKVICEAHLSGRYRVEIVDLVKYPHLARKDGILAIPTLVRNRPMPVRKIIGDLSNAERVLAELDVLPSADGLSGPAV